MTRARPRIATPVSLGRREWIVRAAGGAVATFLRPPPAVAQSADQAAAARRIAILVDEYSAQGFHRTGTAVDRASGEWLAEHVRGMDLAPSLEAFPLDRVDPIAATLTIGDRRIDGVPLFDGGFTGPDGVRGRLVRLKVTPDGSGDADIAAAPTGVNAASRGPLGEARQANRHAAIVAVTHGRQPGLCPSNADDFLKPFGPPVLQVSSEEVRWLNAQADLGVEAHLIAHVARTAATADNVTVTLPGSQPDLPPFVVMTPRSGWYTCASERGGGLACWLEIMRGLRTEQARAIGAVRGLERPRTGSPWHRRLYRAAARTRSDRRRLAASGRQHRRRHRSGLHRAGLRRRPRGPSRRGSSASGLAVTHRTRAAPCRRARPKRCTGAAAATPR